MNDIITLAENQSYLHVMSGGMDSTVLLYHLLNRGNQVRAIGFNYGQRHHKELRYAEKTCMKLGVKYNVVELGHLGETLLSTSGSSLVDHDQEVPEGHYAADNMKKTVVPNRNMIMLSIAGGVAVAEGHRFISTAVHAGDHFIYPDCRPNFIQAASDAIALGNAGFGAFPEFDERTYPAQTIHAPFLEETKEEIAYRGLILGVPFEETWSCYKGGTIHCGRCGTCVERREAIYKAGRQFLIDKGYSAIGDVDQTIYEDPDYWKTALASHQD